MQQRPKGAEAYLRIPRLVAAIAVLFGLSYAVLSRLDAREPVPARGAYPVQRPQRSSDSETDAQPSTLPEVSADKGASKHQILISSQLGSNWQPPDGGGRVHLLRGDCVIEQGSTLLKAQRAVLWVHSVNPRSREQRVQVYLEGDVSVERGQTRRTPAVFVTELRSTASLKFEIETAPADQANNGEEDVFYRRARQCWSEQPPPKVNDSKIKQASAVQTADGTTSSSVIFPDAKDEQPIGQRRLRFFPRSNTPFNAFSSESPNTTPAEQVLVITGGVNLVIDGVAEIGTIDLSADHVVVWTQAASGFDQQATETLVQRGDAPLQIYLEGNIIVRQNDPQQGKIVTNASRAFFDIRENRAILQRVEVKIKTPGLPLTVRINAEEIRQQSKSSFHALNAWVSTSKFGKPGYRVAASDVIFEQRPVSRPSKPVDSPIQQVSGEEPGQATGIAPPATAPWITTVNPIVRIEDTPVFWLPSMSGTPQSMSTPLTRATFENDRVFGAQIRTGWDPFKLFGREAPAGVDAMLLADYLSKRGPAGGLISSYQIDDRFGWGNAKGLINAYIIHDDGNDNLGLDRRSLPPPDPMRGRFQFRDRQEIGDEFTLMTEIGYISDRNYLEQYNEIEWDTGKDNETLAYLKHQDGDTAWTVMGREKINDFDTSTSWLPKGDLYVLGRSFFDGRVNWSSHSSIGYGHLSPATPPTNPADVFTPLPFVADREGLVTMSRHELSAPMNIGQMKIVPYALGEAAYWGQDLNGGDMTRLYGSAGVRGSMMFTKVMPDVQSSTLGLRGLVHKMVFDFDYSYSDSSQNLGDVAQYNEFDDQAQYRFRDRLVTNTFGGFLPDQFDPRFYAVRSGAAHNVTAPYYELVDAQQVLRMGWRHRLQTQAGPIDNPRVRDWMTLDLDASYFPDANRDNFGKSLGLLGGRYAWNVSERTSILANAYYDLFDNAQQLWNVGLVSQRSERGSIYVGVRQVKGAGLDSEILTASYTYQMSPNWVSTFGTAYDLAEGRNRGQSLTVTRIGRDFLTHFGATFDASKNNAGFMISVEPRFMPFSSGSTATNQMNPQMGSLAGRGY
ncbi:MAG: hypothetical protein JWN70_3630 [Planctomycetaceae bacterium]|nr:hypothetical protein [Planctomycetaceae bacterium]